MEARQVRIWHIYLTHFSSVYLPPIPRWNWTARIMNCSKWRQVVSVDRRFLFDGNGERPEARRERQLQRWWQRKPFYDWRVYIIAIFITLQCNIYYTDSRAHERDKWCQSALFFWIWHHKTVMRYGDWIGEFYDWNPVLSRNEHDCNYINFLDASIKLTF